MPWAPDCLINDSIHTAFEKNVTTMVMKSMRKKQLKVSRIGRVELHSDRPQRSFSNLGAASIYE
jgi:hypothetical protein